MLLLLQIKARQKNNLTLKKSLTQMASQPNNPISDRMGYFHRLLSCYTLSINLATKSHNPHFVLLLTSPSILLILTSSLRINKAPWIRSSRFIPFSLAKVSSKPFSASSYVCLGEKKENKLGDHAEACGNKVVLPVKSY